MRGLILLSSYMKSGNTWLRMMLQSLDQADGAVDINASMKTRLAASRELFEAATDVESGHLSAAEIARARPYVYDYLTRADYLSGGDRPALWLKVHEANLPAFGAPVSPFPPPTIAAVVHLVRDPRDVAVSLAYHFNSTLEKTVGKLGDPGFSLSFRRPNARVLPQLVSSWSTHTLSWVDSTLPVLTVRYEDMLADTAGTLAAITRHLAIEAPTERIVRAVEATRFARLRAQEEAAGFRERLPHMDRFFRRGVAGGWRDDLPADLARRVETDHGPVMRRFGYLT
jgi:hypothetical protein